MKQLTTIGIDLAKTVFQVHGVNQTGEAVLKRKLFRNQVLDFFAGLESHASWASKPARSAGGPSPGRPAGPPHRISGRGS